MFIIGNDGHAINLHYVTDLDLITEKENGKWNWYIVYSRDNQADGKVILEDVDTEEEANKRFQELVDNINGVIGR